jgi:beta-galactosidase
VQLPYADGPSPPERYLDLRRFWSDVTISVLEDLEKVRQRNVPNLPAASNLWDTVGRRGFDYLSSSRGSRIASMPNFGPSFSTC